MMAAEAEIVMPERSGYSLGAGKRKASPWDIF